MHQTWWWGDEGILETIHIFSHHISSSKRYGKLIKTQNGQTSAAECTSQGYSTFCDCGNNESREEHGVDREEIGHGCTVGEPSLMHMLQISYYQC
jgi:hypothetical protein